MNSNIPPCPRCGTNKHASRHGRDEFYCGKCKGLYDSQPDEGGYAIFNDPVKAASSREEYQRRRKGRRR